MKLSFNYPYRAVYEKVFNLKQVKIDLEEAYGKDLQPCLSKHVNYSGGND
jgi:hypothetical protein